jgi:1-deoxy-D-xylulose-5-phosphate reductoisomerase
VAVAYFLDKKIAFMDIPRAIAATMNAHAPRRCDSIEAVLEADRWARAYAVSECRQLADHRIAG